MSTLLDGPRLMPRAGRPDALVVLLHGWGADGNDLFDLARLWQALLPGAAFVSPHAPAPHPMGAGRQWFPLTFQDPSERWRGVNMAGPVLDRFLDAELARLGLDGSRLALVGFSQGTMLALHVGLRRAIAPAAIVGYSGALIPPAGQGPEAMAHQATARPPVLLVHGDRDDVVPPDSLFAAATGLGQLGVRVEWHLSAGIGHGIDEEGLRHGGAFLSAALSRRF